MATDQSMSGNPAENTSEVPGSWKIQEATTEEIQARLLDALARVRALPADELAAEFLEHGDIEVDSKEAEAAISKLELDCGRDLAKVEDLRPEQLATAGSLIELIHRRARIEPVEIRKVRR
jgi:hypothetical protein